MGNIIHRLLSFDKLSNPQKLAISFLFVIFMGTLLLMLPISNVENGATSFIDALFISTSATCVTGLSTVVIAEQFSFFGKLVVLMLIQIGGLGLMTLMALFVSVLKNRLSFKESKILKDTIGSQNSLNMPQFVKILLKYVFIFELSGAILLSFKMIPLFGFKEGIFQSIFLSISAFCNAGFDILGGSSLIQFQHDYYVVSIIAILVVLGGVGFCVWFDVREKLILLLSKQITWKQFKKKLSFHTKAVLKITLFLIFIPPLFWIMMEYGNMETIGSFNLIEKYFCGVAEFVFLRTAGFTTIAYSGLRDVSAFFMMIFMFIGGSPGGTAGGVKTTTMLVLFAYMVSVFKGRSQTLIGKRGISKEIILTAMGIVFVNMVVLFFGILLLSCMENKEFITICFEAFSALATVGSSLGITPALSVAGKFIIILMMYIGRIGITTLMVSIVNVRNQSKKNNSITYPDVDIIIG